MNEPEEMFAHLELSDADLITLYPPTEQERVRNELTDTAQAVLERHFRAIFRRWPSLG